MTLKTRESQSFLCINGIQTMSAQSYNLLREVPEMLKMGIDILRISPQVQHTTAIVAAFDSARRGLALAPDTSWNAEGLVDGYWFGHAGIVQQLPVSGQGTDAEFRESAIPASTTVPIPL